MDSINMVNIASKYRDTVKSKKPITVVMLYKSDKRFLPGMIPNDPDLEKDCLFKVAFDKKTNKPYNFVFYDENGKIIYWGNKWMVYGEKIG